MKVVDVKLLNKIFEADFEKGQLVWRWHPSVKMQRYLNKPAGCAKKIKSKTSYKRYWMIRLIGRYYSRSRIIFAMYHGHYPTPVVDHINGDSLDDRISNLRECSIKDNARNKRYKIKGRLYPIGVRPHHKRFVSRITVDGKEKHLGSFKTIELAQAAYIKARKEYFGEYC